MQISLQPVITICFLSRYFVWFDLQHELLNLCILFPEYVMYVELHAVVCMVMLLSRQ